jgi:hypothetical protein
MRWIERPRFVPPAVDRGRLRRVALRYAAHGWPVLPGAYLAGHRFACGRPGCPTAGCHPALDDWDVTGTAEPARIAAWWRRDPHSVLLSTGIAFDVLDVPAPAGLRAVRADPAGPVAVTPTGRWMFLVSPGQPLRPDLAERFDVVHHGRGSWIPAPPTRTPDGRVRWAVPPEQARWRLPDPYAVQAVLAEALSAPARGARPAPVRPAVPRQISTARRAA